MLVRPTPEIEAAVLAEYDADYALFCKHVFEGMERSNPGMADIFWEFLENSKCDDSFTLGLQMASAVYRQLERASNGKLPIVEKNAVWRKTLLESWKNPEAFFDKHGGKYLESGLITKRTFANFLGDAIGHDLDPHQVAFVAIFMLRILESQIASDLEPGKQTH